MHNESSEPPRVAARPMRRLGLSDDELATQATGYRDGLLSGQVMLIAGGGSGMGRATAYLAARLGAEVMVCGRRSEKLQETANGIRQRLGRDIAWKAMTIRDPDQVEALMDETIARFGRLDTVVNSAGGQFLQHAIDYSRKGWLAVMDTNLNGTWWMMQAAAKRWRDAGLPGNIVNIVAVIDRGMPHVAHTGAARAGVVYLSKSLAVEWAPLRIRINCIAPGVIISDGISQYPEDNIKRMPTANPMRRTGTTWDIAEGIVYLSASTGNFLTGELLHIDGGQQLWGNTWHMGMPDWFKDVPST